MCPPCDNEMKSEAIVEHLCASEFGKKGCWGRGGGFPGGHKGSVAPVWAGSWTTVFSCLPRERCGQRCGRCGRVACGQPQSFPEASVPLDVSVGAQRRPLGQDGTGLDVSGTCPGRVQLLQLSTPRYQDSQGWDSGVLAAVPVLLHHPGCGAEHLSLPPGNMPPGDEAPARRITRRSSGAAGGEAPLRAENQMVLVWSLGLGQKWQCLFFGELGGARNISLVFLRSCVLAGMMCGMDSYSAYSHEGAKQLPPSPRLLVPLGFFLAELCCSCQV